MVTDTYMLKGLTGKTSVACQVNNALQLAAAIIPSTLPALPFPNYHNYVIPTSKLHTRG